MSVYGSDNPEHLKNLCKLFEGDNKRLNSRVEELENENRRLNSKIRELENNSPRSSGSDTGSSEERRRREITAGFVTAIPGMRSEKEGDSNASVETAQGTSGRISLQRVSQLEPEIYLLKEEIATLKVQVGDQSALITERNELNKKYRDVRSNLRALEETINVGIETLKTEEQAFRDYLVQIRDSCKLLYNPSEGNFQFKIMLAKSKLQNRLSLLEEQRKNEAGEVTNRFRQLVQDMQKENAYRDLGVFKPFLINISGLIEKSSSYAVPQTENSREPNLHIPEMMAADMIISSVQTALGETEIVQRMQRLREAGFHVEIKVRD
jgi:hypothetical protein